MLVGPVYFAALREAEEKALREALERRRVVAERMQFEPWTIAGLLAHVLRRRRRQIEECRAALEDGAPSLPPSTRSA